MAKKQNKKAKAGKEKDKFLGFGLLLTAVFIFLSFIIIIGKYLLGPFGEVIARILYLIIGKAAYILPFIIGFFAVNVLRKVDKYNQPRIVIGFLIIVL